MMGIGGVGVKRGGGGRNGELKEMLGGGSRRVYSGNNRRWK